MFYVQTQITQKSGTKSCIFLTGVRILTLRTLYVYATAVRNMNIRTQSCVLACGGVNMSDSDHAKCRQ